MASKKFLGLAPVMSYSMVLLLLLAASPLGATSGAYVDVTCIVCGAVFEGWELHGYPEQVYLRGRLIVDHGQWHGQAGLGRYVPRSPYAPII